MFIKKENVDEVLKLATNNCEEYNIQDRFDAMQMIAFNNLLDNIAKKNIYQEGTKISESDLNDIKEKVNFFIIDIAGDLEKKEHELDKIDRMYFNGFNTLMAATDYLYAHAMKKLGCPDIPPSFGDDVTKNVQKYAKSLDTKIRKAYYDEDYSAKTYFDNQRKKNADVVRFNNKSLISDCKSSLANPEQLAQLVAEYQALVLRQKGHGRIWRFFHGSENEDREQLLEDMKEAITKAVGEDINLDPEEKTPSEIAALLNNKLIDKKGIDDFNHEGFTKRLKCSNMIGINNLPKENVLEEQEQNKVNENIIENEKRVSVKFENGEFNEQDDVKIEPAVSNDSVSKKNPQLDK